VQHPLPGRPGSTVTVPGPKSIGDAVDVAEGADIPIREITTDTSEYTIKKAGIGTTITDEAVLNSLGDPIGNSSTQITKSIANKIDNDEVEVLLSASTTFVADNAIGYKPIVDAIDLFEEEILTDKVILVHPKQITQLRKDPDFISREKYDHNVIATGEIGAIAGARVKPSKKVPVAGGYYLNPIIQLSADPDTEQDTAALTIFIKRNINIEKERKARSRKTEITGDQMYMATLTDETKVVILKSLVEPVPELPLQVEVTNLEDFPVSNPAG
jgi:N4-gp56 family major capsid protein